MPALGLQRGMAGPRGIRLQRTLALALPAAAPGLVILAGLVLAGFLRPGLALVLAAALVATAALVAVRLAFAIGALCDTVEELASSSSPTTAPRPPILGARRTIEAIRLTVQRSERSWRERAEQSEARFAAAEEIIAAVQDPLILLDDRRRMIRSPIGEIATITAQRQPGHEPRDISPPRPLPGPCLPDLDRRVRPIDVADILWIRDGAT